MLFLNNHIGNLHWVQEPKPNAEVQEKERKKNKGKGLQKPRRALGVNKLQMGIIRTERTSKINQNQYHTKGKTI